MPNNVVSARQTNTYTIRKGRFLITVCHNLKKEQRKRTVVSKEQPKPKQPTVVKKGRFLVTEHYVVVKTEQPATKPPTVVRKGRFVITHH